MPEPTKLYGLDKLCEALEAFNDRLNGIEDALGLGTDETVLSRLATDESKVDVLSRAWVSNLLANKREGVVPIEEDSVVILRYLDENADDLADTLRAEFPAENDQWWSEFEAGNRRVSDSVRQRVVASTDPENIFAAPDLNAMQREAYERPSRITPGRLQGSPTPPRIDPDLQRTLDEEEEIERRAKPWAVDDSHGLRPGDKIPILRRFSTYLEAVRFVTTLPNYKSGRYGISGPNDPPTLNDLSAQHPALWVGSLVIPTSPLPGELIIGLVVSTLTDNGLKAADVVWFSDDRGIFLCSEQVQDLVVCRTRGRGEAQDQLLAHADVARVLRRFINEQVRR